MQEWFGESLPEEGLSDLNLFVNNGLILDEFVFPCVRKRKKLGTRNQQLMKRELNPSKNEGRGVKAAAGGKGSKNTYVFDVDVHWIALGPFRCHQC